MGYWQAEMEESFLSTRGFKYLGCDASWIPLRKELVEMERALRLEARSPDFVRPSSAASLAPQADPVR
jgi:hypothetical protein